MLYVAERRQWGDGQVGVDKTIGLFCKRAIEKRRYSAKETYNLIDPSHPISHIFDTHIHIHTYTHTHT